MHDARWPLLGNAVGEPLVHRIDQRQLARLGLLPLPVPPLELTLDVGLLLAEIVEADRLEVNGMEVSKHVGQVLARDAALGHTQAPGIVGGADNVPVDELHDVEGALVDRLVLAQSDRLRDRDRRRP